MNFSIQKGKYRHYKGKEYEVLGFAHRRETLESLVVYKAPYNSDIYGNQALWVRPVNLFLEEIEVHGKKVPRFTQVSACTNVQ